MSSFFCQFSKTDWYRFRQFINSFLPFLLSTYIPSIHYPLSAIKPTPLHLASRLDWMVAPLRVPEGHWRLFSHLLWPTVIAQRLRRIKTNILAVFFAISVSLLFLRTTAEVLQMFYLWRCTIRIISLVAKESNAIDDLTISLYPLKIIPHQIGLKGMTYLLM